MKKMKAEILKKSYLSIFDKYAHASFSNLIERGFVFQYDNVLNPDVLFVGINPSFDDNYSHLAHSYIKKNVKTVPYFSSFSIVAKNLSWTHLDLLVFRETKQSYIKDVLFKTDEGVQFICEQLLVSKKLLEYINPKIIVVSNTMARRLMGKDKSKNQNIRMDFDFKFDAKLGTDIISSECVLKGTPVFFTSMLSGQRALDNGSKERLIWHINFVKNQI